MAFLDFLNKPSLGNSRTSRTVVNDANYNKDIFSHPAQTAIIYQSELDYISRCILDYPNIETGGQLFGFWTATGVPIVAYVIGPGRSAQHNPTSFVQDQDYLQTIGKELHKRYRLQHIGEWHSHHQLGLAHPSGGDVNTMQYGVGKPGFPRLLLCIGNCTRTHTIVNAFNFHEGSPRDYVHAAWDVINAESPYRHILDIELQRILLHPSTRRPSLGRLYLVSDTFRQSETQQTHWLTESADNVETMKMFVSMVQSMFPEEDVKPEILPTGEPQITVKNRDLSIALPYGFPRKGPALLKENGDAYYENSNDETWCVGEGSLTESFGKWLAAVYKTINPLAKNPIQSDGDVGYPSSHGISPMIEEDDFQQAEIQSKRIGQENQVLEKNLPDNTFAWSDITDKPVVSILAFPVLDNGRFVLRIVLPSGFPSAPPEVQYGVSGETPLNEPKLPLHIENIHYKSISELFENAGEVYYEALKWESNSSVFKAYTVACVLLYFFNIARLEGKSIMDFIQPLLDSGQVLEQMESKIIQSINNNE